MIRKPGRRLQRLLTILSVPLLAVSAAVVLTATPAHAALLYQGTFRIATGAGIANCLEVYAASEADRAPVILGPCDTGENQRWAIFRDTDRGVYWISAYGGRQPLNKCMDGPDSAPVVHIFGCHGGHQQRWLLSVGPFVATRIQQAGTNECIGLLGGQVITATQQNCSSTQFPPPNWLLLPA